MAAPSRSDCELLGLRLVIFGPWKRAVGTPRQAGEAEQAALEAVEVEGHGPGGVEGGADDEEEPEVEVGVVCHEIFVVVAVTSTSHPHLTTQVPVVLGQEESREAWVAWSEGEVGCEVEEGDSAEVVVQILAEEALAAIENYTGRGRNRHPHLHRGLTAEGEVVVERHVELPWMLSRGAVAEVAGECYGEPREVKAEAHREKLGTELVSHPQSCFRPCWAP